VKYFLFSFLFIAFSVHSQNTSSILLISNQNAQLNFDGEDIGSVEADRPFKIMAAKGEHLIHLVAVIDSMNLSKYEIVNVEEGAQKIVKIDFDIKALDSRVAFEQSKISPDKILNSFVFYSTQGEKFYLILDGKKQNIIPETNIEVYNLDGNRHTVKIIFENDSLNELDEEIKTVSANGEIISRSYAIKKNKKKDKYELELVSTEYKPGTSVWVGIGQGLAQMAEYKKLPCETEDFGTIMIKNNSSFPFNVYLDGIYIDRLYGGASKNYNLKPGQHLIKVIQARGYVVSPKTKTAKVNIFKCADSPVFYFP